MRPGAGHSSRGFTLIEIIVTLVIAAIAGTMVILLGSSLMESSTPLSRLQKSAGLQTVMANITADYKRYPVWKSFSSYLVNVMVIPSPYSVIGQRYDYKCATSGTSGSSEPVWSGTVGTTVPDNFAVWTCQGKLPTLSELKSKLGARDSSNKKYDYGQSGGTCSSSSDCSSGSICDGGMCKCGYYLIENKYIIFDASNNEQEVTRGEILKIKIKNDSGDVLSNLFN